MDLWCVEEVAFWECEPRSDSGIYDKKSTSSEYEISFSDLVYDGYAFVGVYVKCINKILYFNKRGITVITNSEYVGGWGDVTEGVTYSLVKKEKV